MRKLVILLIIASIGLVSASPCFASTTARLTPNGDVSDGGISGGIVAWVTTPLYSKINQNVDDPSTPSTSTPITVNWNEAFEASGWVLLDLDAPSDVSEGTSLVIHIYAKKTSGFAAITLGCDYVIGQTEYNPFFPTGHEQWSSNMPEDTYGWYTFTFSGLSLTQADVNSLQIAFGGGADNFGGNTLYVADAYAVLTYDLAVSSIQGIQSVTGISSLTL